MIKSVVIITVVDSYSTFRREQRLAVLTFVKYKAFNTGENQFRNEGGPLERFAFEDREMCTSVKLSRSVVMFIDCFKGYISKKSLILTMIREWSELPKARNTSLDRGMSR